MPAFVLLFAFAVLGIAFVAGLCIRGRPGDDFETRLDRLRPDDPVFVSSRGFYVVRLASGEVLALDQHELRREDHLAGCVIRYRETLAAGDRIGAFRSDCTGTLYDLTGRPIDGGGPPMRRHPVTVSGTTVTVKGKQCVDGATGRSVPCKPA
jgi:hypothetical protein